VKASINNSRKRIKAIEKEARQAHKDRKANVKSLSDWLGELQVIFNKYVRLRDAHLPCICCGIPANSDCQWHAAHYFSRGHSAFLRFNLWNVHKSCAQCNSYKSGNIGDYTPRLLDKIGAARYEYLVENKSNVVRFDIDYVKRAIKIGRKAVKLLERRV